MLLQCLSRPVLGPSPTTKHRSGSSPLRHQLQRHHCQSGRPHRQSRINVRHLRSPRGRRTSAPTRVRRIQRPLIGERAVCLPSLVAARSCRRGHRLHHHRKSQLLPVDRAPTCRQHRLPRTTSVAKVITRATTTPTLRRARSTRTP